MLELIGGISIGAMTHFALLLLTIPRILRVKRDPVRALAWLYFCLLTPIFGSAVFWMIGDPSVRRHTDRVIEGPPIFRSSNRRAGEKLRVTALAKLQRAQARLGESPATRGNHVEFYDKGADTFDAIEKALRGATSEICMQYYIYRDDELGRRLATVLRERCRAGVKVYFLYDAVGAVGLTRRFIGSMCESGVEVHPFLPFGLFVRRIQINFRNHRKLLIVDRKVAFTGGLNVGMEYINGMKGQAEWYDVHMRLTGPVVPQLREEYAADWMFAAESTETAFEQLPHEPVSEDEIPVPLSENRGWVQTVTGGPDQRVNRIRTLLHFGVTRARQRLWISTPYLVPDDPVLAGLISAGYSGIDVRILMQNNRPDKWLPHFASRYFWEELMDAGVRLYQYQPGMMHAKMLLMDDRIATAGSANLDVRSMALNFEMNIVFYSQHEIQAIEKKFKDAFLKCEEVGAEFRGRGWSGRMVENFARLFAPAL